ncbi:hypothetical protein EDD37DRAFT_653888 [Exophiala viscosa]|uniref:uncharacterized protein n=1 Tax=Exophiala viscosa TaxID=2486360 RepID=UPI00218DB5DC|nr:hypothetical protein EDD37DRAFT_653888 [Exophiala viscosa]
MSLLETLFRNSGLDESQRGAWAWEYLTQFGGSQLGSPTPGLKATLTFHQRQGVLTYPDVERTQFNEVIKEGDLVFAILDQSPGFSKECFVVMKSASTSTTGHAQRMHELALITYESYAVEEKALLKLNFKWGDFVVLKTSCIGPLFEVKDIEPFSDGQKPACTEPSVESNTSISETSAVSGKRWTVMVHIVDAEGIGCWMRQDDVIKAPIELVSRLEMQKTRGLKRMRDEDMDVPVRDAQRRRIEEEEIVLQDDEIGLVEEY